MKRLIRPRCSALTESCRAAFSARSDGPSTIRPPGRPCAPGSASQLQPPSHNCFSRHIPSTLQQATAISANSQRLCHLALDLNAVGGGGEAFFFCFCIKQRPGLFLQTPLSHSEAYYRCLLQRLMILPGKQLLLEEASFSAVIHLNSNYPLLTSTTTTSSPFNPPPPSPSPSS